MQNGKNNGKTNTPQQIDLFSLVGETCVDEAPIDVTETTVSDDSDEQTSNSVVGGLVDTTPHTTKPTGIPWIGEIPTHWQESGIPYIGRIPSYWDIQRGKYCLEHLKRPVRDNDEVITAFRDGEVTLRTNRRTEGFTFSTQEAGYQGIEPGDLVIHGMDAFAGTLGISDSRGKGSPILIVLDSPHYKPYLKYYLQDIAHRGAFTASATGIRVRSCDLRWSKLADMVFILPPLSEQMRIASHLDSVTSSIDESVRLIDEQIEDLKAYRRSLITEVVTHGVPRTHDNNSMQDSGIEWIGTIPQEWNTSPTRHFFAERTEKGNTINLEILTPSRQYGVIPQSRLQGVNLMREGTDLSTLKTIHCGDFCMSLMSFQSGLEYSTYEGVVSPAYHVLYATQTICDGYWKYLFKSDGFISKIGSYSDSLRQGKNITYRDFGKTVVPIPPLDEQHQIAEHLDNITQHIDDSIDVLIIQRNELLAYRQSIITEYVTGQKLI